MSIFTFNPNSSLRLSLRKMALIKAIKKTFHQPHLFEDQPFRSKLPKYKNPSLFDEPSLYDKPDAQEGTIKQFGENDVRKLQTTKSGVKRYVDADPEPQQTVPTQPKSEPEEVPEEATGDKSASHKERIENKLGDLLKDLRNIIKGKEGASTQEIERAIGNRLWSYSGDHNRHTRQAIRSLLADKFVPVAKCGISEVSKDLTEYLKDEITEASQPKGKPSFSDPRRKEEYKKIFDTLRDEFKHKITNLGINQRAYDILMSGVIGAVLEQEIIGTIPEVVELARSQGKAKEFIPIVRDFLNNINDQLQHPKKAEEAISHFVSQLDEEEQKLNSEDSSKVTFGAESRIDGEQMVDQPEEEPEAVQHPTAKGQLVQLIENDNEESGKTFRVTQFTNGLVIAEDVEDTSRNIILTDNMLKVVDESAITKTKKDKPNPEDVITGGINHKVNGIATFAEGIGFPMSDAEKEALGQDLSLYAERLQRKLPGDIYDLIEDTHGVSVWHESTAVKGMIRRAYYDIFQDATGIKLNGAASINQALKEYYGVQNIWDIPEAKNKIENYLKQVLTSLRGIIKEKAGKSIDDITEALDRNQRVNFGGDEKYDTTLRKNIVTALDGTPINDLGYSYTKVKHLITDYLKDEIKQAAKPSSAKVNFGAESRTEPRSEPEGGSTPRGKIMFSKYPGTCEHCKTRFRKGTKIFYNFDNRKAYCGTDCATKGHKQSSAASQQAWGSRTGQEEQPKVEFNGSAEDYF